MTSKCVSLSIQDNLAKLGPLSESKEWDIAPGTEIMKNRSRTYAGSKGEPTLTSKLVLSKFKASFKQV